MRSLIALLFVFIQFSSAQAAEPCPTVELDQNQGIMSDIPVWNQGTNHACFVYSASALASAWIKEVWAKGDARLSSSITNPEENDRAILASSELAQILDAENGRTCEAAEFILRQELSKQADSTHPLFTIPRCTMWGINPTTDGTHKALDTPAAFESKMHELLSSSAQAQPFGIEYCSNSFFYPELSFITNRTFHSTLTYLNSEKESLENFSPNCGFHSAVVIGQKIRHGACYFKVRNSIGTNHPYAEDIENGNYWIPANSLAKNTLRLIQLKSP